MQIWLTIGGMALVTLATRALPMLLLRGSLPTWLGRWLGYVPVAVFTALALPPLLITASPVQQLVFGPPLAAGLAGALVAWYSRSVIATIGTGLLTFWLLRLVI